jgi:hypothetical protein
VLVERQGSGDRDREEEVVAAVWGKTGLFSNRLETLLAGRGHMTLERWIRLIAGTLVLLSLAMSQVHSVYWLWFTVFVGANLFQSALTRWCLMEDFLRKLGVREGSA